MTKRIPAFTFVQFGLGAFVALAGCRASGDGDNAGGSGGESDLGGAGGSTNGVGGESDVGASGGVNSGGDSGGVRTGGSGGTGVGGRGGSGGSTGGTGGTGGVVVAAVAITVSPKSTTVVTGKSLQITATVTGSADTVVTWSVVESTGCGTVSTAGSYTAPAVVPNPAYCHVKAVSHADATKSDTATLNIVVTGSTGQVGVWENVTPAGISLDHNFPAVAQNFGVMDVVVDPVRPSDFYLGVCYQGIWKSTDFGLTWKKVNTGTNGAVVDGGRPWSMVIDNNKNRDPGTPPTLYTTDGYGSKNAVLKSIDGGVNWTVTNINLGAYSFAMDPYDNQHLITGVHEADGIAESTDGGTVWKLLPTAFGRSIYPHFIDTGSAATTRKTWLAVPQLDTGTTAMMTTDGGATFRAVGNFAHPHGGNQSFNAGGGVAYVGASGGGVWRTIDSGATWKPIAGSSDNGYKNGVIGTPGWLYSWDDGANAGGIGSPHLSKAPRNPGTTWTAVTVPAGFNNGGKTMATAFDGTHHVLVSGSWNAGIWRYIEP